MKKTYLLAVIGIAFVALFTGLQLVQADPAAQSSHFTQRYVGNGETPGYGGTWTGPMSFRLDNYSSNGYANWDVIDVPVSATVAVYFTCTGTPFYEAGHNRFDMGNGSSVTFDNASCTGAMQSTEFGYSDIGAGAAVNILQYAGQWYTTFSMTILRVTIDGADVYNPEAIATPIPQGVMPCITGTTSLSPTVQPTRTPIGPTRTVGTPVATPSPTPTRDVAPPTTGGSSPVITPTTITYDGGVMHFGSNLEQLAAVGRVNSGDGSNFLQWSSALGQDGLPGVAMLHAYAADVMTTTSPSMTVVAMFKASGYVSPVALTWWARTAYTLTSEATHGVRIWYLDPDYDGHGSSVWVAVSPTPSDKLLSNVWRKFGAVITPRGGSGRITGIGFTDSYVTQHFATTNPCPSQNGCIYVDDVHLTYGEANAVNLPLCEGTGSTGTGVGTHVCAIAQRTVDVMGELCRPPVSFLDIGGYVAWLGCSLRVYFTVLPENSAQIDAVTNYSGSIEPFGSVRETSDGMTYIQSNVTDYATRYSVYTRNTTDWGRFFNWAAVMHMQLPQFTGNEAITAVDLGGCQFASVNYDVPADVLGPACLVERFATDLGLLAPLQILIDLFCVAAVFMYIRTNWMASMGGDG